MPKPLTLQDLPSRVAAVVQRVCHDRNVNVAQVLNGSRARPLARARFEIWWRVVGLINTAGRRAYSGAQTARLFRVDHTTVIHGLKRLEQLVLDQREDLQLDYARARAKRRIECFNSGVVEEEPMASDLEMFA